MHYVVPCDGIIKAMIKVNWVMIAEILALTETVFCLCGIRCTVTQCTSHTLYSAVPMFRPENMKAMRLTALVAKGPIS